MIKHPRPSPSIFTYCKRPKLDDGNEACAMCIEFTTVLFVYLCMIILLPYLWGIFFSNFEELHGTCQNHDQWMFYIKNQPLFPSWGLDGYGYNLPWWPVWTENHHCIGSGFAQALTEVHQGRGIYHPTPQPFPVHQTGFSLWGLAVIGQRWSSIILKWHLWRRYYHSHGQMRYSVLCVGYANQNF